MNPSEILTRFKAETAFGDPAIDMSTGSTVVELVNPVTPVQPAKTVTDLNSNWAHPVRRKAAFGRPNAGALNTFFHKADHATLAELIFGGTFAAGVPQRDQSFAMDTAKGSLSGSLAVGIRPESVAVTADTGGPVNIAIQNVAKHERSIAVPSISLPVEREQPYKFATAIAVLNGVHVNEVDNITLNVAHNLELGPFRESSLEYAYIQYGTMDITGSAEFNFNGEQYNDLVRGVATGYVYLLFGDSMSIHGASAWSTDDLFNIGDPCVTYNGTTLAADTVASLDPLALTTLLSPNPGDLVVQNPVLIKLNSVEIPTAPENNAEIVKQVLNFETTAPLLSTVEPIEVFIDGIA